MRNQVPEYMEKTSQVWWHSPIIILALVDQRVPRLSNYPRRISKPMPERDPVSTNKVDVIQRMIPQVVLWPPHVHTRARTRMHTLHSHVPPHTYAQRSFNPSAAHWQSKALQCSRVYIRTSQALGLLISYVTWQSSPTSQAPPFFFISQPFFKFWE